MSEFLSHLEELRTRLLRCFILFVLAAVVYYFFAGSLIDLLTEPLRRFEHTQLYFHRPYEAFLTHLKVAALAALITTSPVLLTEAWFFIAPGLYGREKKIFLPVLFASIVLFLAGVAFAYIVVVPFGLNFLLGFQTEGLKPILAIGPYFSFLIGMVLAFGVLFEFPIVVIGLVALDVVTTATLAKSRKVIIVMIFIVAAVLTPSPDPVSQLLLAGPLLFLFEGSLAIARLLERRRETQISSRRDLN